MGNLGYGAYPTHPGEVLKDEIEARGISQLADAACFDLVFQHLARVCGVSPIS